MWSEHTMRCKVLFMSTYNKQRGGREASAHRSPPFPTVLHHSRKVGRVMCHMYGCEGFGDGMGPY